MKLKKQISQHNAEVSNANREKELLAKVAIKCIVQVKNFKL